jgi:hypothetical protein
MGKHSLPMIEQWQKKHTYPCDSCMTEEALRTGFLAKEREMLFIFRQRKYHPRIHGAFNQCHGGIVLLDNKQVSNSLVLVILGWFAGCRRHTSSRNCTWSTCGHGNSVPAKTIRLSQSHLQASLHTVVNVDWRLKDVILCCWTGDTTYGFP